MSGIRANGADIVVECGNIAEADTAARVVAAATATGLPLRGVLHAAAVVEDATLANITDELIDRDWAPKVYGVWNLHQATAGQPLDWFCSFSSVAALFGSRRPGRLRRGLQLAGCVHPLAPRPGPARQRDRVGGVGRDRPGHVPGGERPAPR